MYQTDNDITVRYDTVVATIASGSCLSLTLPPKLLHFFSFSLPQIEQEGGGWGQNLKHSVL